MRKLILCVCMLACCAACARNKVEVVNSMTSLSVAGDGVTELTGAGGVVLAPIAIPAEWPVKAN